MSVLGIAALLFAYVAGIIVAKPFIWPWAIVPLLTAGYLMFAAVRMGV